MYLLTSPNATPAYAIQGLLAAGEDLTADWLKAGRSPFGALAAAQKSDGPFSSEWLPSWLDYGPVTWQVIPPLLGVPFPFHGTDLKPFRDVHRGPDPDRLVAALPRATWGDSVDVLIPFGSDIDFDSFVDLAWRVAGEVDWVTGTTIYRADGYFSATLPLTELVAYEFQVTFEDRIAMVQYGSQISETIVSPIVTLEPYYVHLPFVIK
jgi:hypothetical protein